ncbi:MAG TPA: SIS domain-containing protein [Anaerolineae bacterium]|nr:SIS domain-containing protein [Anaerolineae bacterium]HOR00062.1 SIS domain-containing protein [Anaerolineae bacterium]HPL29439.1 SIS domain-containing protein [Anaerolineae bacterium]
MPFRTIDLSAVRTYPLAGRASLVAVEDLVAPDAAPPPFENPELAEVAGRIAAARLTGRPVIWSLGAHVVKRGLAPLLIDLMERGVVTHLASNGAATIHDFEIALTGHTSEDVATSLADGSFGMAEETGALMNGAVRAGACDGLGLGEALGRLLATDARFQFRERSLLAAAYRLGLPYTVHVAIGTDIIHQHPACDFAALGWATGRDFAIYTTSVSGLEGGVFCNFGSAVIGPEVFLKALAIARNLGHTVRAFTTANFDLVPLAGDYHRPVGDDTVEYYYRPRKNIVNRPVAHGGRGYHITGDHRATIPNLAALVRRQLGDAPLPPAPLLRADLGPAEALAELSPQAAQELNRLLERAPDLAAVAEALAQAFRALRLCFRAGGTLFICGNGGSMADALHIAGELDKAFRLPRPVPPHLSERLAGLPGGAALAAHLQQGLRTIALGANQALTSAIENDSPERALAFAQELYALARPGDALLAISTSGRAQNAINAATVARALGLTVIALTGAAESPLAAAAGVAIRAPSRDTPEVQTYHQQLYHALCLMLEADAFGG